MGAEQELRGLVQRKAAELGFDLCGIAAVEDYFELAYFPEWIAEGHHGEMRYLATRNDAGDLKRASIRNTAPWARSVIVCATNYDTKQPHSIDKTDGGDSEPLATGWISRYAWGERDYHDLILPKLRQLEAALSDAVRGADSSCGLRTWCYVDTGPVVERVAAKYAGLGWIGKNTCVINQKAGSWLFLGVILTSLEFVPALPAADRCGSCTRCIDACPTNAFSGPYKLDASRCISYLTIEKRGEIPQEFREGIGRQVFGCDICQDVCPWNGGVRSELRHHGAAESFQPRPKLVNPDLEWLANISEEDFRETFRGSPIKRAKRCGIRRNAVIAMGNSRNQQFRDSLRRLCEDEDATVAAHAKWALAQLDK